jgi:hypothetical protein
MKKLLCLTLLLLLIALPTASVIAFSTLQVSPSRVSPNEAVSIIYTSPGDTAIDKIEVEGPDGTIYVKDYDPDITLSDGEVFEEEFGTGVSGWSPDADTSEEGWYHVVVHAGDPPYRPEDYFDVSRQFYVPEYAIATAAIIGLGFSLYLIARKFKIINRKYSKI